MTILSAVSDGIAVVIQTNDSLLSSELFPLALYISEYDAAGEYCEYSRYEDHVICKAPAL